MYTIFYTDEDGAIVYMEDALEVTLEDEGKTIKLLMPTDNTEKTISGCDPARYYITEKDNLPEFCKKKEKPPDDSEDLGVHEVIDVTREDIEEHLLDAELFKKPEPKSKMEEIIEAQEEYISLLRAEIEKLKQK